MPSKDNIVNCKACAHSFPNTVLSCPKCDALNFDTPPTPPKPELAETKPINEDIAPQSNDAKDDEHQELAPDHKVWEIFDDFKYLGLFILIFIVFFSVEFLR